MCSLCPVNSSHTGRAPQSITLCVRTGATWVDFTFSQLNIGEKNIRGGGTEVRKERGKEGGRKGEGVLPMQMPIKGVPGAGGGGWSADSMSVTTTHCSPSFLDGHPQRGAGSSIHQEQKGHFSSHLKKL